MDDGVSLGSSSRKSRHVKEGGIWLFQRVAAGGADTGENPALIKTDDGESAGASDKES